MEYSARSSDPSKYEKVPRAVQARFVWLQRISLCILLVFAVILLGGDGVSTRTQGLRKSVGGFTQKVVGARLGSALRREDADAAQEQRGATAEVIRPPADEIEAGADAEEDAAPAEEGGIAAQPPAGWDGVEEEDSAATDGAGGDGRQTEAEEEGSGLGAAEEEPQAGDADDGGAAAGGAEEEADGGQAEAEGQETADSVGQEEAEAEGLAAEGEEGASSAAGEGEEDSGGSDTSEVRTVEQPADWEANAPDSCLGYFGNGYLEFHTVLPASKESNKEAQLACRRHPMTTAVVCFGRNMVLRADRISMSRGGEDLQQVMGRREEEEVPTFQPGASEFITAGYDRIAVEASAPFMAGQEEGGVSIASSLPNALMDALTRNDKYKGQQIRTAVKVDAVSSPRTCAVRVKEPVIFVTRMEYANLFHTSTDWYNTWQAARMAGLEPTTQYARLLRKLTPSSQVAAADGSPKFAAHIVFLDGHNAGPMDEGWTALFLSASYAKHFTGPACFDRPILAPFGYNAAISMGIQAKQTLCPSQSHVRQFGNDFVRGLGLTPRATSTCAGAEELSPDDPAALTKVLFVRRVHYLAHPRHNGQIVRRLDNEDDIVTALGKRAEGSGLHMLNGLFSSMTMREQVQAAQDACVIAGAHGAGLSHVLFAPPGVHLLELQPPAFQRPHFVAYSSWSGATMHLWALGTSTPEVGSVVNRVVQTAEAAVAEASDRAEREEGHRTP